MAQLDRLLSHLAARGAAALKMEPNQQPMLESQGGTSTPLLPTPVPPTLLEHLVKEVLPPSQEGNLATGGAATFAYRVGEQSFTIAVSRGALGLNLRAEPAHEIGIALMEAPEEEVVEQMPDAPAPIPVQPPLPIPPPARPAPIRETAPSAAHPLGERLFKAQIGRASCRERV